MPIVIVTGPPGAGKTTVSSLLAASSDLGVHLVGDQVFHWIAAGYVPPWMPGTGRQNATVTSAAAAAAVEFANAGYAVFVDGIIGPWFLRYWLEIVEERSPTHYVVLRPSRQVAMARAIGRKAADDLIDPEPIERMFDAFTDLGSFEAHVFDSTTQDADATVRAVRKDLAADRYLLDPDDGAEDMGRLAAKYGIDPPTTGAGNSPP